MTQPTTIRADLSSVGAPAFGQLRAVLALVDRISGRQAQPADREALLHDDARLATAYHDAADVTRRRFDALAADAAAYAAAGIQALIGRPSTPATRAAAERLATELRRSLAAMAGLLSSR